MDRAIDVTTPEQLKLIKERKAALTRLNAMREKREAEIENQKQVEAQLEEQKRIAEKRKKVERMESALNAAGLQDMIPFYYRMNWITLIGIPSVKVYEFSIPDYDAIYLRIEKDKLTWIAKNEKNTFTICEDLTTCLMMAKL